MRFECPVIENGVPRGGYPSAGGLEIAELDVAAQLHGRLPAHIEYLGPTLRGALGHVLLRQVCRRDARCGSCELQQSCAYPVVFEGRPSPDRQVMRRYDRVPQPFVLRLPIPSPQLAETRSLRFCVRVFGEARQWLPDLAECLEIIGGTGLGRDRIRFDILEMRPRTLLRTDSSLGSGPGLDPAPRDGVIRWRFRTPLHLSDRVERGDMPLDALSLILAGRRRWHLLTSLFGRVADGPQPPRLERDCFQTLDSQIEPWSITRFSGRQKRSVPLRGVTGSMTISGPWSQAGDWMRTVRATHLGKHGSFGFGAVDWTQEAVA